MSNFDEANPKHPKHVNARWSNVISFLSVLVTGGTFAMSYQASNSANAAANESEVLRKKIEALSLSAEILRFADPHLKEMVVGEKNFLRGCSLVVAYARVENALGTNHVETVLKEIVGVSGSDEEQINCKGIVDASLPTPVSDTGAQVEGLAKEVAVVATYQTNNCHIAKRAKEEFAKELSSLSAKYNGSFEVGLTDRFARVVFTGSAENVSNFRAEIRELGQEAEEKIQENGAAGPKVSQFDREHLKYAAHAYFSETKGWKVLTDANVDQCNKGAKFSDL